MSIRPSHFILAAAALALAGAPAAAQNCPSLSGGCAQTSVGLVPINDLGAGTYQGFQAGLYPGGVNLRPLAHEIGGLAQVAQIVPRNAQGNPDPSGRIVMMSVGMSNAVIHFNAFMQYSNADPLRSSKIELMNGAQGGVAAENMDEPGELYWTQTLPQKFAANGIDPREVQIVWFLQANKQPSICFPTHAQTLKSQMGSILRILKDNCPNVRIVYCQSRIYAGYATTALNPEPWAYEQAFAVKWLIEDQINGDPLLNYDPSAGPVEAPWISWGPYMWADGLIPRSDGLTWECSDFNPDGTHPSQQGAAKNATWWIDFMHTDTTARTWYLAAPDPVAYGTGKTTSTGSVPSTGWTGTPSSTTNDFEVVLSGAVPNKVAVAFHGAAPASIPFQGGTLYVQPPLQRLPPRMTDAGGMASFPVPVPPPLAGVTDHFSVWFRDPLHPDGTTVGISSGLQVRYR